ncbi:sulfotransferase domain-containing protein [Brachybacterium sp. ACRRE]|uniref:sulfotransferase domain-containing protein n=1 Tax=Brachybacterium sp. ACRRE TaxID=2918184 RepID=UPI001EF3CD11|nr:sulfotransferase domain-containing protein [Brachybacterium sp. ACRRE]MCG7309623.1 sulfotransferase domain-containing protein [Brachybacterium sp. ACRRE]
MWSSFEDYRDAGFAKHLENHTYVKSDDVFMASIGASGSTLLSNLLIACGLEYVDLNRDTLGTTGVISVAGDEVSRRVRAIDTSPEAISSRRVLKTHLPADKVPDVSRSILLTRDPRDCLFSWFKYHQNFGNGGWEQVPDSFEQFLQNRFFMGLTPVQSWATHTRSWLQRRGTAVVRFEDLKRDAALAVAPVVADVLDVEVQPASINRAVEVSSFEAMRNREDTLRQPKSQRRVMRRGAVGEWREWWSDELAAHFLSNEELIEIATMLGYDFHESPD